jgi:hypothetical protein
MKKNCCNPNCRLIGTKQHPKEEKWLCDTHYLEIIDIIKDNSKIITLTCHSKG